MDLRGVVFIFHPRPWQCPTQPKAAAEYIPNKLQDDLPPCIPSVRYKRLPPRRRVIRKHDRNRYRLARASAFSIPPLTLFTDWPDIFRIPEIHITGNSVMSALIVLITRH